MYIIHIPHTHATMSFFSCDSFAQPLYDWVGNELMEVGIDKEYHGGTYQEKQVIQLLSVHTN